ncbi:MAG: response regulator [Actinomycetota bacterium]
MPHTTILLVEDDPSVRELIKVLLEVEGYEIVEAADGQEALRRAAEERPSLMILDLMMPDVDGETVIGALKSEPTLASVPVIVVTGKYEALDRCKGLVGDENVFLKPFEPTRLLDRIGVLVGQPGD